MKRSVWMIVLPVLMSVEVLFAQPAIQVSTTELNFGNVYVGHSALDTVVATNTGDETLILDNELAFGGNGGFSLFGATHYEIAPGGHAFINVEFSPQEALPYVDTLRVLTNCPDPAMEQIRVVLHGTGVPFTPPPQFWLLSPADGDTVPTGDLQLVWQTLHVDDPVQYAIYLLGPDSSHLMFGPMTDTAYTIPDGSLSDGNWYRWHVEATYGTYTLSSQNWPWLRYGYAPNFDLISPASGAHVPVGDVPLTWQRLRVDEPVQYTAHVIRSGEPDLTYGPLTDTTCVVPLGSLTDNHAYPWYVIASHGTSTARSLSTFTLIYAYEPPPHTHLILPANGVEITASSETFMWEIVTGNLGHTPSYRLRISAADTLQSHFAQAYSAGQDTSYTVDFADFPNNIVYRWWVEEDTIRPSFQSDELWHFTLSDPGRPSAAGDQSGAVLPRKLEIASVYPNPFNPETQIRLLVPASGIIRAEIYDVLGREVVELLNAPLTAGEHRLTWRASGTSGIYLLRVSDSHGAIAVQKLMVVR